MKRKCCFFGALMGVTFSGASLAQTDPMQPTLVGGASELHGLELGLRVGYGVPLGSTAGTVAGGSADFSSSIKGMIPFWADVGYRINPNWYVGGFFQFGLGMLPSNSVFCNMTGVNCSENDLRAGINVHYHLLPTESFDPWVGIGAGYEWLNETISPAGQPDISSKLDGFEFGNIHLGVDYKVSQNFGVGPFVTFTIAQFANSSFAGVSGSLTDKKIHEWLIFGIRGVYDLAFD